MPQGRKYKWDTWDSCDRPISPISPIGPIGPIRVIPPDGTLPAQPAAPKAWRRREHDPKPPKKPLSPSVTPHTSLRSTASVVAEKTPLPSAVHRRPTSPQFDLANSTENGLLPPTGLHPLPALTARLRY